MLLSPWPTRWCSAGAGSSEGTPPSWCARPGAGLRPGADRADVALEVRRAAVPDDVASAERVFAEGYPVGDAIGRPGAALPASLLECGVSIRIAAVDGEDVAVGMGHVAHGCVNLCGAATLPQARRTGAWGALVRARVEDAPRLPAVAFTSDDSRPGFEHLGFVSVLRFTMWLRAASPP